MRLHGLHRPLEDPLVRGVQIQLLAGVEPRHPLRVGAGPQLQPLHHVPLRVVHVISDRLQPRVVRVAGVVHVSAVQLLTETESSRRRVPFIVQCSQFKADHSGRRETRFAPRSKLNGSSQGSVPKFSEQLDRAAKLLEACQTQRRVA